MVSDWFAHGTLLIYAGIALAIVGRAACRCPDGWRVWLLYSVTRVYCDLMFRRRAGGPCLFPENGPALIIANHRSPTDPMMIWSHHADHWASRRPRVISFLMAKEYYEIPGLVGWISRVMRSIPVDRSGHDMKPVITALRRLKAGNLIGVFPEGGINNQANPLLPGNTGVAWLALRTTAPLFPVFIRDAPRGKTMFGTFFTPARTTVLYGPPIELAPWRDRKPDHATLEQATAYIMQQLAAVGGVSASGLDHRRHTDASRSLG